MTKWLRTDWDYAGWTPRYAYPTGVVWFVFAFMWLGCGVPANDIPVTCYHDNGTVILSGKYGQVFPPSGERAAWSLGTFYEDGPSYSTHWDYVDGTCRTGLMVDTDTGDEIELRVDTVYVPHKVERADTVTVVQYRPWPRGTIPLAVVWLLGLCAFVSVVSVLYTRFHAR